MTKPIWTHELCKGAYGAIILDAEENGIAECAPAHAPILAAAPELLEALKDTLNMLRAAHMQCGIHHDSNKRVVKARAAIAAATAQNPQRP